MNKQECCAYVLKKILDNFDQVIKPSSISELMNLSDLLINIRKQERHNLAADENIALNRRYCEIALYPSIEQTYDNLDKVYDHLYVDYFKREKALHEILYEILCKKLG